jgi:hypothetical protein
VREAPLEEPAAPVREPTAPIPVSTSPAPAAHAQKPGATWVKQLGSILLVIGVIGLLQSLTMDTTVRDPYIGPIHNIGKLNDRTVYVIVTAIMSVTGLACVIVGSYLEPPGSHKQSNPPK